jgi:hypothetical protein
MIYNGLNRTGMIGEIKTKGGGEISEVYGGIGESDPIYYKQREMVGTSPMQFKALGLPLKDYRIYGETLQDGTPSPEMPVDVVGCGVRMENLYNPNDDVLNFRYDSSGNWVYDPGVRSSGYIGVRQGNFYVYSFKTVPNHTVGIYRINFLDSNKMWINSIVENFNVAANTNVTRTFTVPAGVAYIRTSHYDADINDMIVEGSTPPDHYIPYGYYGYKLPVTTTNGTEYPIYLGQVPTTRRIKKLVLTGEETSWGTVSSDYYAVAITNAFPWNWCVCTHCAYGDIFNGNVNTQLWIKRSAFPDYPTLTDFKSFLAQQYANGTPVTIWYVLAEPETGIVNEPIHRIGEYADTISMAQAGVTIPTVSGENVLTVPTEVPPSEIDLTGRLKTSGYGQLLDKNLTAINDSTGTPIFIRG